MSDSPDATNDEPEVEDVLGWVADYYHYPILVLLTAFTFFTRLTGWENFYYNGEVVFRGNDPYYHYRSTQYVVHNFPQTMPFDPWTNFPYGTSQSQFGTLYDQLMATAALVIGLGNPSPEQVKTVVLFAAPVFGTLVLIPTYLIGRRLGDRFGGLIAVAVVALSSGSLLRNSLVGFGDHQIVEVLFQVLAILGVMVALSVAERDLPVYELVADREFAVLRPTLGWGILGGVGLAGYIWAWPPAVLLIGILGVFFVVHLSAEYLRGQSPEHAAFVGVLVFGTAGVLSLSTLNVIDISATSRSLLHPLMAFAGAIGCVFMAWLARIWDQRDFPAAGYPAAIFGVIALGAILLALLSPDTFDYFISQLARVIGLGTTDRQATIGEAKPLKDAGGVDVLYETYKLALVGAGVGVVTILFRQFFRKRPAGQELLILVWTLFMISAAFTQVRFLQYLTVPVAILNATMVGAIVPYINWTPTDGAPETYEVLTVATILMLVLAPMAVAAPTPSDSVEGNTPGPGIEGWQSSLEWMENNTPAEGQYGNPNGDEMEYLGTFKRSDDYDYPEGSYGVLSWWDYGHWITVEGGRIPVANPFQQNAGEAAEFLLAQSEPEAENAVANVSEDDAEPRYVMVDRQMVGGKFSAPTAFTDKYEINDFFTFVQPPERGLYRSFRLRHQSFYQTMVVRLYYYHGSAQQPSKSAVNWNREVQTESGTSVYIGPNEPGQLIQQFNTTQEAQDYVNQSVDGSRQVGGINTQPVEFVPALSKYRLVHISENGEFTKTFERVDGATLEGTGPPNSTIRASVPIEPVNGQQFTYVQEAQTDEDGNFQMTVPYSTTGYDNWGPEEGYTNVSARANGTYTIGTTGFSVNEAGNFTQHVATVEVSEANVIGEESGPIEVELEEEVIGSAGGSQTGSGSTDDGSSDGSNDGTNDTQNAMGRTPALFGFVGS